MKKFQQIEIGQLNNTHGIKGELKLTLWCDAPETITELTYITIGEKEYRIQQSRLQKSAVILSLEGISTLTEAEKLKGKTAFAPRDAFKLPEGVYFIQDLIGLRVIDADSGRVYGTLSDVSHTGANDVYHVATPAGEALIPAVPPVVKTVDIDGGVVKIAPIEGLFDEN